MAGAPSSAGNIGGPQRASALTPLLGAVSDPRAQGQGPDGLISEPVDVQVVPVVDGPALSRGPIAPSEAQRLARVAPGAQEGG